MSGHKSNRKLNAGLKVHTNILGKKGGSAVKAATTSEIHDQPTTQGYIYLEGWIGTSV